MTGVILTANYLEKKLGVSISTIRLYICRAEFSHIIRFKRKKLERFYNVTTADIERLKELVKNKSKKRGIKTENEG